MERVFKFYYVYQITNKINGKIYVGVHATDDLNDGYMGSGLLIRQAITKYGIENFVKAILFKGISYRELLTKEAEIVTTEFINREDTYNLREGGDGGAMLILEKELARRQKIADFNRRTKTGVPRPDLRIPKSEETKRKISKTKTIPRQKAVCVVCGKEFEIRLGSRIKGKCCSRSCTAKLMNMTGVANRNK